MWEARIKKLRSDLYAFADCLGNEGVYCNCTSLEPVERKLLFTTKFVNSCCLFILTIPP